jgi:hypothetical protein
MKELSINIKLYTNYDIGAINIKEIGEDEKFIALVLRRILKKINLKKNYMMNSVIKGKLKLSLKEGKWTLLNVL